MEGGDEVTLAALILFLIAAFAANMVAAKVGPLAKR